MWPLDWAGKQSFAVKPLLDHIQQVLPSCSKLMGRPWIPIYQSALQKFQLLPLSERSWPSVWVHSWAKSLTLPFPQVPGRQCDETWETFWNCNHPPEFVCLAGAMLWAKLKVCQRLWPITSTDECPLCPTKLNQLRVLSDIVHSSRMCMCSCSRPSDRLRPFGGQS